MRASLFLHPRKQQDGGGRTLMLYKEEKQGGAQVIKGVVPIEKENKRVNWHKIRAEYISGTSQVKLAQKYHVSKDTVAKHCRKEGWTTERNRAKEEVAEKVIQKTAEKAADNATIAADIKHKGLMLLNKLFDDFAKYTATEYRETTPNTATIKRLRDLTSAYKDLTEDMASANNATSELLQSLIDLERGRS